MARYKITYDKVIVVPGYSIVEAETQEEAEEKFDGRDAVYTKEKDSFTNSIDIESIERES